MKARVKATGEIVEISLSHIVYDGGKKIIWYNTPQGASFTEDELEFIDTEENFDYWTRLEHQYAGQFMQAMISSSNYIDVSEGAMADASLRIAHALVEKYKKEERK